MKDLFPLIDPHVITNKKGRELGVFIEMKDYKLLEERLEDLSLGILAYQTKEQGGDCISLEDLKKELMADRKNKYKSL